LKPIIPLKQRGQGVENKSKSKIAGGSCYLFLASTQESDECTIFKMGTQSIALMEISFMSGKQ